MSISTIEDRLKVSHAGDENQLEVIFSKEKRLLIEAPAGYGKTKTMVSKIAFMLASKQIPYPKRLLALTFSVNAAYKIKKDVAENIPNILEGVKTDFRISDKIFVTNYHGFARRILKRYGSKLSQYLLDIEKLQSVDDRDPQYLMRTITSLTYENAELISNFNLAVKKINSDYIKKNIKRYNELVVNEMLPLGVIPYNAILSLAYMLLNEYVAIREFYQKLFTAILVDEYQDTNILSFILLRQLIGTNSNVILMGDSLQRIYGFIGAVPDLLNKSIKAFELKEIKLGKNYRFQSNKNMLLLDNNIRRNAENPFSPKIEEVAEIEFTLLDNQLKEAEFIISKSIQLIKGNPETKVAILVKQRGNNIDLIIEQFNNSSIPFFFGLFTDDDPNYIDFNRECLYQFIDLLGTQDQVTKKAVVILVTRVKNKISDNSALSSSMFALLDIFLNKLFNEFSFLSNEERIFLIKDTFEHNGLKQYIEFVDAKIIISTVHGAKGLEWDYVILPDMEACLFPGYYGLCKVCGCMKDCNLIMKNSFEQSFLEELSVFYVAVTRARKQVFFSASKYQINSHGIDVTRNVSCFLKLPGIKVISRMDS